MYARPPRPHRAPEPNHQLVSGGPLLLCLSLLIACAESTAAVSGDAEEQYLSANLVGNPALDGAGPWPTSWHALADDGVVADFFVGEEEGQRYLRTAIRLDSGPGHARWWFEPVQLEGDSFYEYSDVSKSFGDGRMIWSCGDEAKRRYFWAGQSSSSSDWREASIRFYLPRSCLVTVMHVLDRPGYLQIRLPSLRKLRPKPLSQPMVSIAFDDGHRSNLDVAARELEKRGWRGSFYLVLDYLGREGFLEAWEAAELAARGHEIGSHSASHRPLVQVSVEELRVEVEKSQEAMTSLGGRGGFAYPFGAFDEVIEDYVGARASYVRTSLHGLNDAAFDRRRVRVHPITSGTSLGELESAVADAARSRTWLVFLLHDLETPAGGDPYQVDPATFVHLLNILEEREVEVLPVIDAVERIQGPLGG